MHAARSEAGADDFSDLKKKKKKSGKTFDLEAFEAELAATEASNANGDAGSDDEAAAKAGDDEVPEGDDPFAKEGAGDDEGKTKCELAFEKKGWMVEDREYHYTEASSRSL